MSPDPQAPSTDLTVGDLSRLTGLTTATIRAWESRYGFPRPRRLASGHRRYAARDVDLVAQVLRRRDAGVRLDVAIGEVTASRRTPAVSVFAEMRRRQPQLTPRHLRKSTLLALTWAMEDECCARAQQPTLFAAFQHERYLRRAHERWTELARTARHTVVFAAFDDPDDDLGGSGSSGGPPEELLPQATIVRLPPRAPMRREWSLVCDAADHPAALAAWELPGQSAVRDRDRVFEAVWTVQPPAVRDAARACVGLVGQLAPGHAHDFDALDDTPAASSDDLRAAEIVFSRFVDYVDRSAG